MYRPYLVWAGAAEVKRKARHEPRAETFGIVVDDGMQRKQGVYHPLRRHAESLGTSHSPTPFEGFSSSTLIKFPFRRAGLQNMSALANASPSIKTCPCL